MIRVPACRFGSHDVLTTGHTGAPELAVRCASLGRTDAGRQCHYQPLPPVLLEEAARRGGAAVVGAVSQREDTRLVLRVTSACSCERPWTQIHSIVVVRLGRRGRASLSHAQDDGQRGLPGVHCRFAGGLPHPAAHGPRPRQAGTVSVHAGDTRRAALPVASHSSPRPALSQHAVPGTPSTSGWRVS